MTTQTTIDIDKVIYNILSLGEIEFNKVMLQWTEEDKIEYRTKMNDIMNFREIGFELELRLQKNLEL